MPKATPEGQRTLSIDLPEELAQRLDELVRQTRRSVATEVTLALEFWLDRQGFGEAAVEPVKKTRPK
jgi:predicted transcriptional regulator